jgi:hypothetical protein
MRAPASKNAGFAAFFRITIMGINLLYLWGIPFACFGHSQCSTACKGHTIGKFVNDHFASVNDHPPGARPQTTQTSPTGHDSWHRDVRAQPGD